MSPIATLPRFRPQGTHALPSADLTATDVREIGPLHVTWYEDGSVWARGLAPLHRPQRLDDRLDAMRLRDFAQEGARIDHCTTQGTLDRLAVELSHLHRGDLLMPYLMQWVEQRVRVIAGGLR